MHRIESTNVDESTGVKLFTNGPPGTTVNAEIMNAIQEEIANVIEQAGLVLLTKGTDTRNQLWDALQILGRPYDYIVASQANLNDAIERVAANQYKIKDDYTSIFVKQLAGGYNASGPQSFLSGGDTWGYIQTNNCAHIEFEAGAYLDFAAARGYIEVNTDDATLRNVDVAGSGAAGAMTQSYLLNANRVTYDNCKARDRLSTTNYVSFQGSGTAAHNYTSKYKGCITYDINTNGGTISGFKACYNLSDCGVRTIDSSSGVAIGFEDCVALSNCMVSDMDTTAAASHAYGFESCKNLNSCYAYDIEQAADNDDAVGFKSCSNLSSCEADDIDASGASSYSIGFEFCLQVSGSLAKNIANSVGEAIGFKECDCVSGCRAETIDYTGVGGINAYGFLECYYISACYTTDIDVGGAGVASGYDNCSYVAALSTNETSNPNNGYVDTDDGDVVQNYSTPVNGDNIWT